MMVVVHKDKRIFYLLSLLAVIYAAFIILDIASMCFFLCQILKYAGIVICFFMAAVTSKYTFDHDNAKLLIAGLAFTLAADALFLFASAFAPGIACFIFVQLCYIRRYRKESFQRSFVPALIVILFCAFGFALKLQLPYIALLGIVYAVLIITATGLAFRSNLPRINKRLVQTGMLLFLMCDTNVMLSFFSPKTSLFYEITNSLVWVFYLPAQVLLSLSALEYDWNKKTVSGRNLPYFTDHAGKQ